MACLDWTIEHTASVRNLLNAMDPRQRAIIEARAATLYAQLKQLGLDGGRLAESMAKLSSGDAARLLQLSITMDAIGQVVVLNGVVEGDESPTEASGGPQRRGLGGRIAHRSEMVNAGFWTPGNSFLEECAECEN